MADLKPVDYDPFAGATLTPVEGDPFAGATVTAVDHDPFNETPDGRPLSERVAAYEEANPFFTRMGQRLHAGVLNFQSGRAAGEALGNIDFDEAQRATMDALDAGQLAVPPGGFRPRDLPGARQVDIDQINRYAAMAPEQRQAFRAQREQAIAEGLQTAAAKSAESAAIPRNPAVGDFAQAMQAGEYGNAIGILLTNPVGIVGQVSTESLPTMLPALAAGLINPTLGAAVMGGTSAAQEYGSSVLDYLQNQGVNTNDPAAIKAALSSPEVRKGAADYASTRAAVIGAVDAASGKLASKMLVPERLASTALRREAANELIAQPLAQAAAGAGGEALAQKISTGEVGSPADVALEAIGEFGTAPAEAASFGIRQRAGRPVSQTPTSESDTPPQPKPGLPEAGPATGVPPTPSGADPVLEPSAREGAPVATKPTIEGLPSEGERVGLRREGGPPQAVVVESIQDGYVFFRHPDGSQDVTTEVEFRRDLTKAPPPEKQVDATTVPTPDARATEITPIFDQDPYGIQENEAQQAAAAKAAARPVPPQQSAALPDTSQIQKLRDTASSWIQAANEAQKLYESGAPNAKTPQEIAEMRVTAARIMENAAELQRNLTPARVSPTDVTAATPEQLAVQPLGALGRAAPASSEAVTGPQTFPVTPPKVREQTQPELRPVSQNEAVTGAQRFQVTPPKGAAPSPQGELRPVPGSEAERPQPVREQAPKEIVPWQQRLSQGIQSRAIKSLNDTARLAKDFGVTPAEVTQELSRIASGRNAPIQQMKGKVRIDKKTKQPVQSAGAGKFRYTPKPSENAVEDLYEFVLRMGGINPTGFAGELKSRDLQLYKKAFKGTLVRADATMNAQQMADAAMQEGFMIPTEAGTIYQQEQGQERVGSTSANVNDFLDKLSSNASGGRRHFRLGEEPAEAPPPEETLAPLADKGFTLEAETAEDLGKQVPAYEAATDELSADEFFAMQDAMERALVDRLDPEAQDALAKESNDDYPDEWYAQEIAEGPAAAQPETPAGVPESGEPARAQPEGEGRPAGGGEDTAAAASGAGAQGEPRAVVEKNIDGSDEYKRAVARHDAAVSEFRAAQDAYRSRKIGDSEFLAAREKYDAATREFDAAYEAETNRPPTRPVKTEMTSEGEQPVLLDLKKDAESAVLSQKARDAKNRGRMGTDKAQKKPGGMFAQPEEPDTQTDLGDFLAQPGARRPMGAPVDLTREVDQQMVGQNKAERAETAKNWVLQNGRRSGHEYVVTLSRRGALLDASTNNAPGTVAIPSRTVDAMKVPGGAVDIHHNHPNDGPLSGDDINVLTYPGLGWMISHGNEGKFSAARVSPRFNEAMNHLTTDQRAQVIRTITDSALSVSLVRHHRIGIAGGNFGVPEAAWRGLHEAGVIDYLSDHPLSEQSATIADTIRDQTTERLLQHGVDLRDPNRTHRPAAATGAAEGLAEISGGARKPQAQDALRQPEAGGVPEGGRREEAGQGAAAAEGGVDAGAAQISQPETGGTLARLMADESGALTLPDWNRIKETVSKVFGKKKTAGDIAEEALRQPLGRPNSLRRMARWGRWIWNGAWISSQDVVSAAHWNAMLKAERIKNELQNRWFSAFSPYAKLSPQDRATVDAMLEYYRLYGITPQRTGRNLAVRIPDRPPPFGDGRVTKSKTGQVLAANKEMTDAIFSLTDMFGDVWSKLHEAQAREAGYRGEFTPEAIKDAVDNAASPREKRAAQLAGRIYQNMQETAREGYAVPLQRYGDVFISVVPKAPEDGVSINKPVVFELINTRGILDNPLTSKKGGTDDRAVNERLAELRKQYPADRFNITSDVVGSKAFDAVDIPQVERAMALMNVATDRKHADAIDNLLSKLYEERRAGPRRQARNVPGYSQDFERGIVDYMMQMASVVSRVSTRDEINSTYDATQAHADDRVRKYWQDTRAYMDREGGDLAGLRKLGFFLMMWGQPASAALDLTQTPMITMHQLGAWAGVGRGATLANGAMLEAMTAVRAGKRVGLRLDLDRLGKTPAEKALIKDAAAKGILGPQISHEFQGGDVTKRFPKYRPAAKKLGVIWDWGASMKNTAEEINRVAALLAAFRAAQNPALREKASKVYANDEVFKQQVGRDLNPADIAKFFVDDTQFVAGKVNRAPAMRGIGGLLLQFKNYPLNYLRLMHKNFTRMGTEGKIAGSLMLMSLGLMSGLLGIPFGEDLLKLEEDLQKGVTGVDPNWEYRFRQWIGGNDDSWGQYAAEVITHGIGRNLFGVDMGERIGMGQLFPGASILDAVPLVSAIAGRTSEAIDRFHSGQPMGALAAASGLAGGRAGYDWMRAFAQGQEGIKTRYGSPVVKKEDVTLGQLGLRALGAQPTSVTRAQERAYSDKRIASATSEKKTRATTRIATMIVDLQDAKKANDQEAMKEITQDIEDEFREQADAFRDPDEPMWMKMTPVQKNALKRRILTLIAPEVARLRSAPKTARPEIMNNAYPE